MSDYEWVATGPQTRALLRAWPAMVLFSGGFDSTAALHWALGKHAQVRALTLDYGQPHRDAEVYAARTIAARRGVDCRVACTADAFPRAGLLAGVKDNREGNGQDDAVLPMRNLVFLSLAASYAMVCWPDAAKIEIIVGCCREDADGFPDCCQGFIRSATETLTLGAGRAIRVCAPWVKMPKARIREALGSPDATEDLAESWSCYRGTACGTCHACVVRALAFADHEDKCLAPRATGGDVDRARRLSDAAR